MVKLLVATTEAQGHRDNDYAWAVDGELVYIPDGCDCPNCDCSRGFAGMASARATTTALVVDRPDLAHGDLVGALTDSLTRQSWLTGDPDLDGELLAYFLERIQTATSHFPAGAVLERTGEFIRRRAQVPPLALPSD